MNTPEDVVEKINSARKAQTIWAALPFAERSRRLKPVEAYLADHGDELADLICRDNGKTRIDALATEILPAAMALRYYRKKGRRFLAPRRIHGGNIMMFNKRSYLIYEPYGVVGIISPWNYPFSIPFSEVVMALLAGNGVVLKTASDTPQVGQALGTLFSQIDLPPGLFAYVSLPGKEAGPAFINGGIDKLFFTGSTAVGRQLMALGAPRLLPLVLELGGADAALVRADADLDRAALGILWAGFSNAGQSCGGVQRVLVHRGVYEPFLEKLGQRVRSLRLGPPSAWTTDMGPMTTARQKATVRDQVRRCLGSGARIVAQSEGGDLEGDGLEMGALVLADVRADMPIMEEEIFGPVVAVIPVADDQEALEIANRSSYGLTGSIWTRDRRQARKLAQALNAGAIMVNDHLMSHGLAETPWGGFGDSGLGRTHGELGFHEMLKTKVVVEDILPGARKNIWWHPYSESVYRGLRSILTFLYGSDWKKRLAAVPGLVKIFFRYWDRS